VNPNGGAKIEAETDDLAAGHRVFRRPFSVECDLTGVQKECVLLGKRPLAVLGWLVLRGTRLRL
jgi:hypothetical protein